MQIEGRNAIIEALAADITIDKVCVANGVEGSAKPLIAQLKQKNVRIQFLDRNVLDKQSTTGKHQGFIAEVSEYKYATLEELCEIPKARGQAPFFVVLDGITDPHNLGSIIRSCECAGVHGIIIGKNRSVSVNDTVVKASAGAVSHLRVGRVTNIHDAIRSLKQAGVFVYAAENGGQPMTKANLTGSLALVIGSEGEGVTQLSKKLCDGTIGIPVFGKINSLNAGVACGVVLYEALRQRTKESL